MRHQYQEHSCPEHLPCALPASIDPVSKPFCTSVLPLPALSCAAVPDVTSRPCTVLKHSRLYCPTLSCSYLPYRGMTYPTRRCLTLHGPAISYPALPSPAQLLSSTLSCHYGLSCLALPYPALPSPYPVPTGLALPGSLQSCPVMAFLIWSCPAMVYLAQ